MLSNEGGEAVIDGTPYVTLAEAMDAAKNGETVVLQQDVNLDNYYYLKSGNAITLDLNGHNVTSQSTAFMVKAGSELTLTGSGTISGSGHSGKGGAVVTWGGVINLEGDVVLTSNASDLEQGGAVWMYYGTFNMNGGRIENASAERGGAVSVEGYNKSYKATFNMNAGVIIGCSANDGGGIYVGYNGIFNMNGGVIENCTAEIGAGLYIGGSATVSGGQITDNFAEWYAAGVLVDEYSSFAMNDGLVAHNRLGEDNSGFPGGIFQRWDSTVLVKGGAVYDNDLGDFGLCAPATASVIPANKMQADNMVFTGWHIKPESGSERDTQGALPDKTPSIYSYIYCTAIYEQGEAVYSQTISLGGTDSQSNTFEEAKALAEKMVQSPEWNGEPIVIEVGKTLTVSGAEEWSFGENKDNIIMERDASFDGYLVNVSGSLTLQDITIQGTGIGEKKHSLLKVMGNGQLTIEDGTVLQNNGAGISGKLDDINRGNYDGGAIYSTGGNVTMTGGVIRGNSSEYLGGAISINGGTFEMSGGEISENESHCGGGVSVVRGGRMEFTGGEISGNTAMVGGGICIGGRTTLEIEGQPELVMGGGKLRSAGVPVVSGNTAKSNGGGIYVQMNSVATITSGEIVGNQTTNEQDMVTSHRGAGIYVNGGSGTSYGLGHEKPVGLNTGLLKLENVEIANNSAPTGAGLAGCATSQVEIYVTDGAVFHDNHSSQGRNNDIELDRSSNEKAMYYVSDFMLGGGMYQWYWHSTSTGQLAQPSQYQYTSDLVKLGAAYDEADIEKAQAKATVLIADNTTNGYGAGGGIGTNGAVVIGHMDESTGKVTVNKLWEDDNNKAGKRPQSIQVSIRYGNLTMTNLALTAENNWTVTRTGLNQEILDGLKDAELTVEEVKVDGYTFQGATAQVNGNEVVITLTNQYVPQLGSLRISKTVTGNGGDRNKDFTFNLTLLDSEGKALTGSYPYTGKGSGNVTNGSRITLKHGESVTITGLPVGSTYTVTEVEANRGGYTTTATGNQGVIAADRTAEASFVNNRQVGSLRISKTVTGNGGDRNKDFTFNLTLLDSEGKALTGSYPYTGKGSGNVTNGSRITLKHGESVTITGLPVGSTYTVTEVEANRDGYTTTATGNQGVIAADRTAEASFVNNRQVGSLRISKTVTGNGGDRNKDFTFSVTLLDSEGKALTGSYPYTGKGSGNVTNGSRITLKHGESVTISGLPIESTYTVTEVEANRDGYTTTATGNQGVIVANRTAQASFVNNRQVGSLRINKTVTGNGGDRTRNFTFNVTLRDGNGNQLTGAYPYTGRGTGTITSGGSLTLRSGESVTITGLPAGSTYTVTEVEANRDGYTTTATGNQGVIVANRTAEASFVNNRTVTPVRPRPVRPDDDDDDDDDDDPTPPRPTVTIPDSPVPMAPPTNNNLVTIMDPSTPLASQPAPQQNNLVTILDPTMPLGNLPITGGYGLALAITGAALLGVAIFLKKK